MFEDEVDLLERPSSGLGEENPDRDGDEEVCGGEYRISRPTDICERNWSNHHDGKVRYPVGSSTWKQKGSSGQSLERSELRGRCKGGGGGRRGTH